MQNSGPIDYLIVFETPLGCQNNGKLSGKKYYFRVLEVNMYLEASDPYSEADTEKL